KSNGRRARASRWPSAAPGFWSRARKLVRARERCTRRSWRIRSGGPTTIDVNAADTGEVPDSGPTVASRTCMIVGRILQRCAEEMRARLGRLTPREYLRRHGPLVITKQYERPATMSWDDTSYQGDAYGSYGWGCDVVELEVARDTREVKPTAVTSVHEMGKAMRPT